MAAPSSRAMKPESRHHDERQIVRVAVVEDAAAAGPRHHELHEHGPRADRDRPFLHAVDKAADVAAVGCEHRRQRRGSERDAVRVLEGDGESGVVVLAVVPAEPAGENVRDGSVVDLARVSRQADRLPGGRLPVARAAAEEVRAPVERPGRDEAGNPSGPPST